MKKLFMFFVLELVFMALIYVSIGFISGNFNAFEWGITYRIWTIVAAWVIGIVVGCSYWYDEEKVKNEIENDGENEIE